MTMSPQRLAEWRAQPVRRAIRRWENRTYAAALRKLARRHRGEFARILFEIRMQDPRPEAVNGGGSRAA